MVPDLPIERFRAGDVIFCEGDAPDYVYVIIDGSVEIFQTRGPEDVTIATLGAKDVFGELALVSDASRNASAHALSNTSCYVIAMDEYQRQLDQASPMIKAILKILSNRLRETTDLIEQQR